MHIHVREFERKKSKQQKNALKKIPEKNKIKQKIFKDDDEGMEKEKFCAFSKEKERERER